MKPVLLNTNAVKAILAGRKTTFRLPIKPQPEFLDGETGTPERCGDGNWCFKVDQYTSIYDFDYKPPYQPGDLLYVRETWAFDTGDADDEIGTGYFVYRADDLHHPDCKWWPSVRMPKEAARIFLRVKSIRVERLQDITDEGAIKEGIARMFDHLSDAEYAAWGNKAAKGKTKADWPWNNYLWHGDFGRYGTGNRLSDAWPYQSSGYDAPRDSFSSLWNLTVDLKDWGTYGWDANPWVWVIEFEEVPKKEVGQ